MNDPSGIASSTAFDFLRQGVANAVYRDQESLLVLDGKTGRQNFKAARSSLTLIEYPVVADIDNDGSADIVVVSSLGSVGGTTYTHTVEVLQDAERRWGPRLPRHQRARGRHHPEGAREELAEARHVPHQRADPAGRRVRAASGG